MAGSIALMTKALSLQQASKAFARARICDAARELFYREGYAATTFEKIAEAAGTRRTTLYSHFRDKADILEAIGAEYYDGLYRLARELPGPVPSRIEIDRWVASLAAYVRQERAPATLLIGLGMGQERPALTEKWSRAFLEALASELPAFRKALDTGDNAASVRAWARMVLRELSLACLEAPTSADGGAAVLTVAAVLFERFVRDHA